MSIGSQSQKTSGSRALSLIVVLVFSGAAFAQSPPADGPPLGGPDLEDAGTRPPAGSITPPLPTNAPEPSADPRNLEGTWYREYPVDFQILSDMYGYKLPFTPAGKKVSDRRRKALKDHTPFRNASVLCLPPGQHWQMGLSPFQIFQSKDFIDVQFQEYHGFYEIVMDPAKALPPAYLGSSVGHWDGDTLVVETTRFKDEQWLSARGRPASKDAKITQRIRKMKSDHWYLEVVFTLDDPTYYTHPWSWVRDYSWRPDMTIFNEYNCELQTGAEDGIDLGLTPEPRD